MQSSYEKVKIKKTKKVEETFDEKVDDILTKKKNKQKKVKNFEKIANYLTKQLNENDETIDNKMVY